MSNKEIKKAYETVCEVYEKYKDEKGNAFDDLEVCYNSIKNHLLRIEWEEKYGIKLPSSAAPYTENSIKVNPYMHILFFVDGIVYVKGYEKHRMNRKNRQYKNGWLLKIRFYSGAYIFGRDYPEKLFHKLIKEIRSYKPDYDDPWSHSMYWKLENAKEIYDDFQSILDKYFDVYKKTAKERKIEGIKKEMRRLERELKELQK